jgi:hypothetical protein
LGAAAALLAIGFFGTGGFGLFSADNELAGPAPGGGDPPPVEAESGTPVTPPTQVASITLEPPALRMREGETGSLTPSVIDAEGNPVEGVQISWSSSEPTVAYVDGTGLVTARSGGMAVITAAVGSVTGQAPVDVLVPVAPPPVVEEAEAPLCPDPVVDVLDALEAAMDDPDSSLQELRRTATACWERGEVVGDQNLAYAAWIIGLITVDLETCTPSAIEWLRRAVRLDPGSQAYRVALNGCGGR